MKYSIELPFLDPLGTARWALALDRTRKDPYSEDELALVNRIYPHLCNLHQKFFLNEFSSRNTMSRKDAVMELMNLTAREKEIVNLLCDGMSPEEISQLLKITKSTTNRHIANIFGKMGVDRLQTLLVRLLGA